MHKIRQRKISNEVNIRINEFRFNLSFRREVGGEKQEGVSLQVSNSEPKGIWKIWRVASRLSLLPSNSPSI